jgi:hypothetical protein
MTKPILNHYEAELSESVTVPLDMPFIGIIEGTI